MRHKILTRKPEPPTSGEEHRTIGGRQVRCAWRRAGFGEFLAWCYLPGPDGLHNQGTGFEARAASREEALDRLESRVAEHLSRRS